MKILAYSPTYYGSGHNAGAETTLHDLLRACKTRRWDVTALISRPFKDGSASYVLDGVKVQAYASKHDPFLYFPHADVVLSQFECAQRASYIGDKLSVPTVQVVHNYTEYATNLAVRYNDCLVYNSEHVKQHIDPLLRYDKPSVVVHPIVNPRLYSVETTREYITLVNLSDGEPPFYNKGYETFYHLAEQFPDQKFLGVKGAYGNQIIRDLPNVTIAEHTNNILSVYRQSKIVLMPSEIESWGRVAIEAACSGIPSLTSSAPGLLESGIGYERVQFGDQPGFADALQRLLDDYDKASVEAKEKAETLWSLNEFEINIFLDFLEEIASKRG